MSLGQEAWVPFGVTVCPRVTLWPLGQEEVTRTGKQEEHCPLMSLGQEEEWVPFGVHWDRRR